MTDDVFYGSARIVPGGTRAEGGFTTADGQTWYQVSHYDAMPPFFMTISNPADLWMFISTTGGLTAGRESKDSAIFPYLTVDKVTESAGHTGAYTRMLVKTDAGRSLWMPLVWGDVPVYERERLLQKSVRGDAVAFVERNISLGLEFRVVWDCSPAYGIRRSCTLTNIGDAAVEIEIDDGIRNILPAGVHADAHMSYSTLLDAYKRSEADGPTGLGIFALSATLTDRAEPSESLLATTVWSYGMDGSGLRLSEESLGATPTVADERNRVETDAKGRRGAYIRTASMQLGVSETREWGLCADVHQNHGQVISLRSRLATDSASLVSDLKDDINAARDRMTEILGMNDGLQDVGSLASQHHHASNVLYNVMRGGYFVDGYNVDTRAFAAFAETWNRSVATAHASDLAGLPETMHAKALYDWAIGTGDLDLARLALEYFPVTFSRRHGDPSRPWNQFAINTHDEEGNPIVGYQGNWRDIFQNWEALTLSFPDFIPSVIAKFVNATTADGYNPYRISQEGIDWEIPEPDNPWSNIGYWGDHQIVYLSRLMEHSERYSPGTLIDWLNTPMFVYANVPYRIASFDQLLKDPRDSIAFDDETEKRIEGILEQIGADAKLVLDAADSPIRATLMEKLLVLILAKCSNYVANGGIWVNNQRPEWNDANNALAGWGLSVVTVAYLSRFIDLCSSIVAADDAASYSVRSSVGTWLASSAAALASVEPSSTLSDRDRFALLEKLGQAGSAYRTAIYSGQWAAPTELAKSDIATFLDAFSGHLKSTINATRLEDGTFESYQMMTISDGEARVRRLYPMLEGQVAGLSSGSITYADAVSVLEAIRKGPLFRGDQHSYMLYPNRELPRFLEKNTIANADVTGLKVVKRDQSAWAHVLSQDENGSWHFPGTYRNADDLIADSEHLPAEEQKELLELFEATFDHGAFTGRSGTFFGFEGLGSVYWHMVSKLLVVVQELITGAIAAGESATVINALKERYLDIRAGLGFMKEPETYGAIPLDAYSHTPWGKGAKQPGMTGQVKEEVVTRFAELGLVVANARIRFEPTMILDDQWRKETNDFAFTFCGVEFRVTRGGGAGIEIVEAGGGTRSEGSLELSKADSRAIFARDGSIASVNVGIA